MQADIEFAAQNNVGYVYVTDRTLASNPYAALPSYWDQEVAEIAAVNTPEPGSLATVTSGCMLTALFIAAQRLARRRREPR
jgi:hypothetical protein